MCLVVFLGFVRATASAPRLGGLALGKATSARAANVDGDVVAKRPYTEDTTYLSHQNEPTETSSIE